MPFSKDEQLLSETLAEAGYAEFKERLREQMLSELRRMQKRKRQQWLWALAACFAAGFALFSLLNRRPEAIVAEAKPESMPEWMVRTTSGVEITRTERVPLDIISTQAAVETFVTFRSQPEFVETLAFTEIVRSADFPNIELLDDAGLVNLFAGCAVGFVPGADGRRDFVVFNCPNSVP